MGYIYAKNGATQQTVTTAYAADGRIASAGFMHGGVLRNFTYGYLPGSNLLEKLTMPINMTLAQGYEAKRDLLTGMTYMRSDALVTQRSYSYDASVAQHNVIRNTRERTSRTAIHLSTTHARSW